MTWEEQVQGCQSLGKKEALQKMMYDGLWYTALWLLLCGSLTDTTGLLGNLPHPLTGPKDKLGLWGSRMQEGGVCLPGSCSSYPPDKSLSRGLRLPLICKLSGGTYSDWLGSLVQHLGLWVGERALLTLQCGLLGGVCWKALTWHLVLVTDTSE